MKKYAELSRHAESAAELLKVLSHPERLMVLCQLIDGEKCVGELMQQSRLTQSAFSQQLAVLKAHDVVQTRKVSKQVFYSMQHPVVFDLLSTLDKSYCQDSTPPKSAEPEADEP